MMSSDVRLCSRAIDTSRGMSPKSKPQSTNAPRLVEGDPILHAVAEPFEADLCILLECVYDLRRKKATIFIRQGYKQ